MFLARESFCVIYLIDVGTGGVGVRTCVSELVLGAVQLHYERMNGGLPLFAGMGSRTLSTWVAVGDDRVAAVQQIASQLPSPQGRPTSVHVDASKAGQSFLAKWRKPYITVESNIRKWATGHLSEPANVTLFYYSSYWISDGTPVIGLPRLKEEVNRSPTRSLDKKDLIVFVLHCLCWVPRSGDNVTDPNENNVDQCAPALILTTDRYFDIYIYIDLAAFGGVSFTPADLILNLNKRVRQCYIRRRLMTTYKALERLSQSQFNLDKIAARPDFVAASVDPVQPLSAPTPPASSAQQQLLPLTLTDVERDQGRPLSKYMRNMMIFNWLHTLEDPSCSATQAEMI